MSYNLRTGLLGSGDLDVHVHLADITADLITTGTLPTNVLPNLDMSQIATGDLSSDRVDFTNNIIVVGGGVHTANLLGEGPGSSISVGTDLEFTDTVECNITGCHAINADEITSTTLIATDLTTHTLAGVSTGLGGGITLGSNITAASGQNPNLELNSGNVECGDIVCSLITAGEVSTGELRGEGPAASISVGADLEFTDTVNCSITGCHAINADEIHTDAIDTNGSDYLTLSCDITADDGDDKHINLKGGTLEVETLECLTLGSIVDSGGTVDVGIESDLNFRSTNRILQCPTIDSLRHHHAGYLTTDFFEQVVPASQFVSSVRGTSNNSPNSLFVDAVTGSVTFNSDVAAGSLTQNMNLTAGMVASFTIPENYYIAKAFVDCESSGAPVEVAARLTFNDIHNLPTINTTMTDLIVKQWDNSSVPPANVTTISTELGVKMNTPSSSSSYDDPFNFVTNNPMGLLVEPTLAQHQAAHRVLQAGQHFNMFIGGRKDSNTTYAAWPAISATTPETRVRGVVLSLRRVEGT
jgi:hypothetical protein